MSPKPRLQSHYLALDVAMRNTGVVVYDSFTRSIVHTACIQTERREGGYVSDDNARCVRALCVGIEQVLLQFPTVKEAFAEIPHGGAKSSRAASLMGLAIGGVIGFLFARAVKVRNVSPLEVKRLVRQQGEVEKAEVQEYAERKFGRFASHLNKGQAEHVADAAGTLLAGLRKYYHA